MPQGFCVVYVRKGAEDIGEAGEVLVKEKWGV